MKEVGFRKKKTVLNKEIEERKSKLKDDIEGKTKGKRFSATKIETFKTCPMKYKFKYVDRIKKKIISAPMTLGVTFHKCMEYIYNSIAFNIPVDKDIIKDIIENYLDRETSGIEDDKEWNKFKNDGFQLINYYIDHKRKHKPLVLEGNVCTEVEFNVPIRNVLTNETHGDTLTGSIDLITEELRIVDFKTASKSYNQAKVDSSIQLTAYSYAFREMFRQVEDGIWFDVIVKKYATRSNPKGEPYLNNNKTTRKTQDFVRLYHVIEKIKEAEKYNVFYPANPGEGSWCLGCPYTKECESWQGV